MKKFQKFVSILACVAVTSSCSEHPGRVFEERGAMIDPELGLTRDDYRKPYTPAGAGKVTAEVEPPVPDLAEILAAPKPPKLGEAKLISIAVTDDVPLKDVLIELARLADIDIEVDSSISGGISFRAKDRPFNEVIERISDLAGLRYTMKNNVLRLERDTPYVQEYSINFLNVDRIVSGNINVGGGTGAGASSSGASGGSGSSASSGGSGGPTSGSSSNINSSSDSDFWSRFDDGIKQILSYSESKRISNTDIAAQPAPGGIPGAPGVKPPLPALGAAAATNAGVANGGASGPANGGNSGGNNNPGKPPLEGTFYIINKQASALTVSATEKQHDMIKRFLKTIEANTSSQVLIEAKVLEVSLNDTYQSGINWNNFGNSHVKFNGSLNAVTSSLTSVAAPSITLMKNNILGSGLDLSAAVHLLDEFGTTRALSSPRLHAMNNQQAVLSFAEGIVYFNVQINTTDAVLGTNGQVVTPSKVNVTSTQKTAPIGIVLTLQPSIAQAESEVTLSVRPTLTRLTKFVNDPGFEVSKAAALAKLDASSDVATKLASVTSQIPQIETRELDSIVKIKSGQTLVIGGLLEDKITNTDAGVPVADEIPFFGNLFKSVEKSNTKKELVIFIRATIVSSGGGADKADRSLYDKFGHDPRPLNFNQPAN